MKALVLAGGTGTRLRPFTDTIPKQLIPIANRPVLEHVLLNIRDIGVTDVGIVVGAHGAKIRAAVGDGRRLGLRVGYIPQDEPRGLAHCVQIARLYLGGDDFVLHVGDNVLPEGIAEAAGDFAARRPDAHLLVHKVPDPRAFGVAELAPDGTVRRLVEKPERPASDLAVVGVYFFTAAIHQAVNAIGPSRRGELEITDAIQWLLTRSARVTATEYTDYWQDIGTVEGALACNRRLVDRVSGEVAGQVDAASRLTGPVVVGPGSRIVRSHIQGPVIIGANTLIEDSTLKPHTSVGRNCTLRGVQLTDCIVLEGTAISEGGTLAGALVNSGTFRTTLSRTNTR